MKEDLSSDEKEIQEDEYSSGPQDSSEEGNHFKVINAEDYLEEEEGNDEEIEREKALYE